MSYESDVRELQLSYSREGLLRLLERHAERAVAVLGEDHVIMGSWLSSMIRERMGEAELQRFKEMVARECGGRGVRGERLARGLRTWLFGRLRVARGRLVVR